MPLEKEKFHIINFKYGSLPIRIEYSLFSEANYGSEMHHIQVFVKNDSAIPLTKTGYRSEIFPMRVGKRLTKDQIYEWFLKMNYEEDLSKQLPLF